MPFLRSAMARALAALSARGNVRASKIAKSLPSPCIFRNEVIVGRVIGLAPWGCQRRRFMVDIVSVLILDNLGAKCPKHGALRGACMGSNLRVARMVRVGIALRGAKASLSPDVADDP